MAEYDDEGGKGCEEKGPGKPLNLLVLCDQMKREKGFRLGNDFIWSYNLTNEYIWRSRYCHSCVSHSYSRDVSVKLPRRL